MELIVFDLDGTLLNSAGELSPLTMLTLGQLAERGIAYTVATGRTLHASRAILSGQGFVHPHVYNNGVMIWHPGKADYSHTNMLSQHEIQHLLQAVLAQGVTPFVFALEPANRHVIYHPPMQTDVERQLVAEFVRRDGVDVLPISRMPVTARITNISALGEPDAIDAVLGRVEAEPGLVAYTGTAVEDAMLKWIDIHHSDASKGRAVAILRRQLGADKVLCFGDGDNDLSLFSEADESYAPDNARPVVKDAATAVIGHQDADGVAIFLRQRFCLPATST